MATAMPRGLRILQTCRGLAVRSAPPACARPQALLHVARPYRLQSNDAKTQIPSVTESNATNTGSSITEVSSSNPIDSVDDGALEQMLYGGRASKQGGLTDAQEEVLYRDGEIPPAESAEAVLALGNAEADELEAEGAVGKDIQNLGHKWPLPQKPYPEGFNVKKRYHDVVEQITRLMMRDGKLATAQRRRRRAFTWMLEAVEKRPSKGSGRTQFAHRLADEVIAVVEGRSSVWEKRKLVHKQGTTARANVEKRVMIKKGVGK
ncbi:ribosomal protein S7 [Cordyceps militaris CM01]|uniref:Ribosomal protein S7 n=1 Tax=Cordyceps militaris (strain CM01) TaxID=983644 RepID=G3JGB0_CORMM|nr:ribosomal protein S7 [Cordyceps militaris CM01]EGX93240.1 ribosomal protein S7 [Cordyceps militaris CM01]